MTTKELVPLTPPRGAGVGRENLLQATRRLAVDDAAASPPAFAPASLPAAMSPAQRQLLGNASPGHANAGTPPRSPMGPNGNNGGGSGGGLRYRGMAHPRRPTGHARTARHDTAAPDALRRARPVNVRALGGGR